MIIIIVSSVKLLNLNLYYYFIPVHAKLPPELEILNLYFSGDIQP
jgi:hypothetical protein